MVTRPVSVMAYSILVKDRKKKEKTVIKALEVHMETRIYCIKFELSSILMLHDYLSLSS